ncbi:MAG: hypothetical protein DMF60_00955 [Acidobacteria bacterium]|nr:MAG: hypothetical protein DMF60_00955 [Acidobacteriota bacterium]
MPFERRRYHREKVKGKKQIDEDHIWTKITGQEGWLAPALLDSLVSTTAGGKPPFPIDEDHIWTKITGQEGWLAPALLLGPKDSTNDKAGQSTLPNLYSASLLIPFVCHHHFNPFFNLSSCEIGFIHQANLR